MKFSALDRNKKPDFAKLQSQFSNKKVNNTSKEEDKRFWKPSVNKDTGRGRAIIKFLPSPKEDGAFFIERKQHWYSTDVNGQKQWFVHWCPTDIGKPCFQCQKNGMLWSQGTEEAKAICRKQGRNRHFYANILVIKDYQNPENDGTVRIYEFPATIRNKLIEAIKGVEADEASGIDAVVPIDPFGFYDTAKFDLRIEKALVKKEGQISTSYEASKFFDEGDFSDDMKYLEDIMNQVTDLEKEFLNEEVYSNDTEEQMKKDYFRCHPEELRQSVPQETERRAFPKKEESSQTSKIDLSEINDDELDLNSLSLTDDDEIQMMENLKKSIKDDDVPF